MVKPTSHFFSQIEKEQVDYFIRSNLPCFDALQERTCVRGDAVRIIIFSRWGLRKLLLLVPIWYPAILFGTHARHLPRFFSILRLVTT